jgi:hypothetical protein
MISSFEVGATFKILDQASPALVKILRQVRTLREELDRAKASMADIGKAGSLGLSSTIGEVDALSASWKSVTRSAEAARVAMGQASASVRNGAALAVGGAGGGGGGGRARLGQRLGMGGGGAHLGGPGLAVGGGHMRLGGPAIAAGAALGWGIDQAAKTEKYVWQMEDITGSPHQEGPTRAKFRKTLQDFQARWGWGIDRQGRAGRSEAVGRHAGWRDRFPVRAS